MSDAVRFAAWADTLAALARAAVARRSAGVAASGPLVHRHITWSVDPIDAPGPAAAAPLRRPVHAIGARSAAS